MSTNVDKCEMAPARKQLTDNRVMLMSGQPLQRSEENLEQ